MESYWVRPTSLLPDNLPYREEFMRNDDRPVAGQCDLVFELLEVYWSLTSYLVSCDGQE